MPVRLGDVANIQLGPEMRRGVTELNGEGEVAGGVVILRSGKNARAAIDAVKAKLAELQRSLPQGVEIVPTYDRSQLIDRARRESDSEIDRGIHRCGASVCGLFLWHLRSALVAIISLPLGILVAFIVMRYQGVSANIMSLGGVAIAIGAMVDAAVVMIENAHKRVEAWTHAHPGQAAARGGTLASDDRGGRRSGSRAILQPAHHHALLHSGLHARGAGGASVRVRWHSRRHTRWPLPRDLSVTLVPVLMGYWIRGRIPEETRNPLNRGLIASVPSDARSGVG